MKRLDLFDDLLTTFVDLMVGIPAVEYALSVWEKNTADVIFGKLDSIEKLGRDQRLSRDAFFRWTSENQEHISTFFVEYLCVLIAISATSSPLNRWWEYTLIVSISATVKNSNDKAAG